MKLIPPLLLPLTSLTRSQVLVRKDFIWRNVVGGAAEEGDVPSDCSGGELGGVSILLLFLPCLKGLCHCRGRLFSASVIRRLALGDEEEGGRGGGIGGRKKKWREGRGGGRGGRGVEESVRRRGIEMKRKES
jgi:hypothetical protein